MRLRGLGVGVVVAAVIGAGCLGTSAAATPSLATSVPTVSRLAGADRIGTAVAISRHAFSQTAASVYLARMDVFADAVAAGTLTDGPVLLVPSCTALPQVVKDEVTRLSPARVVALGGTGAICDQVLTDAAGGRQTARLAGVDRYLTSLEIARERAKQGPVTEVYAASGLDSPDAVVGGQLTRGPILLTGTVDRSAEYNAFLNEVKPARVVALGGPGVVTETQLASLVGVKARLAGGSRYETAAAIAMREFQADADVVYLARGDVYADAVAAGALKDGPVMLVESCALPAPARERIAAARPMRVVALGGPGAVCDAALSQAQLARTVNGGRNTLVSLDHTGWAYGSDVVDAAISADNTVVAWVGNRKPALEPWGVYVTDLASGAERRVSVPPPGKTLVYLASEVAVSGNGRRVAFAARDSSLGVGATVIYVHDLDTGATKQVSRALVGSTYAAYDVSISDDGSKVAFVTREPQTDVDPGSYRDQIYVATVDSGTITMVSTAKDGLAGDAPSYSAEISADGGKVAFVTRATNLFDDGLTAQKSAAVADLATGKVERISLDSSSTALEAFDAAPPQMSADGNVVAFLAVTPPSSGTSSPVQLLVRDRGADTTTVASVTSQGQPTTRPVNKIELSADGKVVAFTTDLAQGATPDSESGVLRRDLTAGRTRQVAVQFTGAETTDLGTASRYWLLGMSPDASRVVMLSRGPRLVPNVSPEGEVPVLWTELSAR